MGMFRNAPGAVAPVAAVKHEHAAAHAGAGMKPIRVAALAGSLTVLVVASAVAQTNGCEPVEMRAGRTLGCFITSRQELGALPRDTALYWHIDAFPTEAVARAAGVSRSTVVRSVGRIWLFTIAESELEAGGWKADQQGGAAATGGCAGLRGGVHGRASSRPA